MSKSFIKYCPNCKSKDFSFENDFKFHCKSCDFVLYHNIAAAVAVIIKHNDKILFTVRNVDPDKGKWDLPGGFIDPNETAEEAACREIKEELGIEIDLNNLKFVGSLPNVYHYKEVDYNTLDLFFEYQVEEKIAIKKLEAHEISETIWVKISELNLEEIAFDSQRKFLENYQ